MSQPVLVKSILYNLDILGGLKREQTLCTEGNYLVIDQRPYQPVSRFFAGDSRETILKCVEHTWSLINELLTSYGCILKLSDPVAKEHQDKIREHLREIKERNENVFNGLETLKSFIRYQSDPGFQVRVSLSQNDWTKIQNSVQSMIPAPGMNAEAQPNKK